MVFLYKKITISHGGFLVPWYMSYALKVTFNRANYQQTITYSKLAIETLDKVKVVLWGRSNVFIVYTFFSLTVSIVDSEHLYVSWVYLFVKYDSKFWLTVAINCLHKSKDPYFEIHLHLSKTFFQSSVRENMRLERKYQF